MAAKKKIAMNAPPSLSIYHTAMLFPSRWRQQSVGVKLRTTRFDFTRISILGFKCGLKAALCGGATGFQIYVTVPDTYGTK